MARKATNTILHKAKSSKSDEFYTLREDIERELTFYKDSFHGKTVYCNCDNPKESNFFKYFFAFSFFRIIFIK
uniref:adenine-specific methyltransferase EcoRI family protein n=1 Tax=uncultured Muribaculum sp. TaxID=1918613 RepID=UPI0026598540